ncbi:hypothetical protein CF326_g2314 [Tilletia indica]|nr:hypothetical protein CF326_g2314 [Tilletia indica]
MISTGGGVWQIPPDRSTATPDFTLTPAQPQQPRRQSSSTLILPLFTPESSSQWWTASKHHHRRSASLIQPRKTAVIHTRRTSLIPSHLDNEDEEEDDEYLLPLPSPSTTTSTQPSPSSTPQPCHHRSSSLASFLGLRSRINQPLHSSTSSSTTALTSRFNWRRSSLSPPSPTSPLAPTRPSPSPKSWTQRALPHLPALLILATIFTISTTALFIALTSLPIHLPPSSAGLTHRLSHLTLTDIRALTTSLKEYARTGRAATVPADEVGDLNAGPLGLGLAKLHVLLVLSALFTWKQAFTIPGSIIMNVVFGALYGTSWGTLYTSLLTAFGGLCCYLLCSPLAPLIASLPGLKTPLHAIRTALDPDSAENSEHSEEQQQQGRPRMMNRTSSMLDIPRTRSSNNWASLGTPQTYSYLLLLRLLPIIPYGITNIACSVLRTPILPFVLTLGLGSVPWNVLTCQVGELLEEVLSVALDVGTGEGGMGAVSGVKTIVGKVLWKKETMVKLGLVSLASVAPVVLGRMLQGKKKASPTAQRVEREPLLEMQDAVSQRRRSTPSLPVEEGGWTSSATAPLSPLIRPPKIAAPAPQHRPWWLDDDEEDLDDLEVEGEGRGVYV